MNLSLQQIKLLYIIFGNNEPDITINTVAIPLVKYANNVAIFTKYTTKESLYEKENNSSEIKAFMPLNKNSGMKKLDDRTYVVQYFVDNITLSNPVTVEKIQNQADYEANKIKNQYSGYKVLIQNMGENEIEGKRYGEIITTLVVLKPEYFESNDFKLDVASGGIVEDTYMIDFDTEYVTYDNVYTSRIEL